MYRLERRGLSWMYRGGGRGYRRTSVICLSENGIGDVDATMAKEN